CFGVGEAEGVLGRTAFYFWLIGLGLRVFGWLYAFDQEFSSGSQALYFAGGIVLAFTAAALVSATRIFEPLKETFRSHKFVRGAFAWLIISGILLIFEPLHLQLV